MKGDTTEYVYGINAVLEFIGSGRDVESVLINTAARGERLTELRKLVKERSIPVKNLPPTAFLKFGNKNHQGIIAIVSAIQYTNIEQLVPKLYEEGKAPFLLVLDHITDVRNFGAICRSAACFGVDAVVIPDKGTSLINDFAIKASSGALSHISVCRTKSLLGTARYLSESGIRIISCSEDGEKNYFDLQYSGPCALVLGSEEEGISHALLKASDAVIRIPMTGPVKSLNVSVACGIVMSEVFKQRLNG